MMDEPVCRVCGCTQYNGCPGGCFWVTEDLCSECVTLLYQSWDELMEDYEYLV